MNVQPWTWTQILRVGLSMGWSDFLLRYRGSLLGYFWSLLIPLSKFLVIYVVFDIFIGIAIDNYGLYLLIGLTMWDFFSRVTEGCMWMLHEKASLIQKVPFPRMILVIAVGWKECLILTSYGLMLVLFLAISPVALHWSFLLLSIPVIALVCISLTIGMLLSAFALRFRDLPYLWSLCLTVLFWATPIVYHLSTHTVTTWGSIGTVGITDLVYLLIRYQPLTVILTDVRAVALLGQTPSPISWILAAAFIITTALSAWMFVYRSRSFLQEY